MTGSDAPLPNEFRLVGDQRAGIGIKRQKLTRGLAQAMARHNEHRLVDQAQPALLHNGGGRGQRLADTNGISQIGSTLRLACS